LAHEFVLTTRATNSNFIGVGREMAKWEGFNASSPDFLGIKE
jgi:hypothetical protein